MKKELIAQRDPKSPISEVFRTLRTNIQFMNSKKGLKTLLVTSTVPGEGKSWISSNLATTFAQAGKRTLLIDADMRKGRLYKIFGIANVPGLSNFLSGIDNCNIKEKDDPTKYIRQTEVENLYVMTAGNVPPNPSELLADDLTIKMLEKLDKYFDFIILDGTPSMLVTDSIILSRIVDTTVIVTAHKVTRKDNLLKVKKSIENVGGKIAGVIRNKVPVNIAKYNNRYYYSSNNSETKQASKDYEESYSNNTLQNQSENDEVDFLKDKKEEILKQLTDYMGETKNK